MSWTDVQNLATQIATLAGALAADTVKPEPIQVTFDELPSLTNVVSLKKWYMSHGEYEREERVLEITTNPATIEFQVTNIATGGGVPLGGLMYPVYAIELNGKELGRFAKGTDVSGNGRVTGDVTGWADGAYTAKIIPYDASGNKVATPGEVYITTPDVWLNVGGTCKDWPYCYADTGNYALVRNPATDPTRAQTPLRHYMARIPKSRLNPQSAPALPAWTEAPAMASVRSGLLTRINLNPCPEGGIDLSMHVPCKTKSGIVALQNRQAYYWADLIRDAPWLPMKDGPRGVCTTTDTIAGYHGRLGRKYVCDPWSAYVLDSTGTKRTLLGLRSKDQAYPRYWQEATADDYELIGDWSAVTAAGYPARLKRCWKFWFDPRTTGIDPNATPISSPPGAPPEQPHPAPVVAFWITEDGVLRSEHSGTDHLAPPVIKPWYMDAGIWGGAYRLMPDGTMEIFCTNRSGHEITVISGDKPQTKLRSLAKSSAVPGQVDPQMVTWAYGDSPANVASGQAAKTLRAQYPSTVVAPEGCDWYGPNLAVGSYALGEVRLFDPDTGAFKGVVCRPFMSWGNKGHFVNVAVADGKNGGGEFGTTYCATFAEQANYGHPECFLPDPGTDTDGTALTNSHKFTWAGLAWDVPAGPGYKTMGGTYPLFTALGHNELSAGDTQDGFKVWRMSTAAEQQSANWPDLAKFSAGCKVMRSRQDQLIYGSQYARRLTDEPLPWGVDPNLDYVLTYVGWTQ